MSRPTAPVIDQPAQEKTQLERTEELFEFLQGRIPEGYSIPAQEIPRLDADQAWTVVWYLGNRYWQVPDFIERCDVCGELYDSEREGRFREADEVEYGRPSGFRCDEHQHDFDDEDDE